jgi:hypothetical protein
MINLAGVQRGFHLYSDDPTLGSYCFSMSFRPGNLPCQGWGREFESHRPLHLTLFARSNHFQILLGITKTS